MSTLNVANISDGTDTVETGYVVNGSAKVYGKINQESTDHPTYSHTLNISSTTDAGAGKTTVEVSSAMSDGGYPVSGGVDYSDQYYQFQSENVAAGSFGALCTPDYSLSNADGIVSFVVNGDLA